MITSTYKSISLALLLISLIPAFNACTSSGEGKNSRKSATDVPERITSNIAGTGQKIEIEVFRGKSHNHPTFAIWLEDTDGKYVQTLFVTRAIGQGVFTYGDKSEGTWKPGEVRRPAALPYWSHKRGVKATDGLFTPSPENPVPDAYSGATPKGSFNLQSRSDQSLSGDVILLLEVNQTWDWNEYWTNGLYPDDKDYKTSCQPSLVYSAKLNPSISGEWVELTPVGHGHYAGKDGSLTKDISTLTTAKQIMKSIKVRWIQ
ncbi:MAG: hypothetical protein IPH45_07125 [Bacteroidales bacterium]|nr:hypothetical protein [Bacteroidales bacterium]